MYTDVKTDFTEKQLNKILQSESFELVVRTLADRNPYYARRLFRWRDPMQTVYELCVFAYNAENNEEAYIDQHYRIPLEERGEIGLYLTASEAKEDYYRSFVISDEPLALDYDSVIHVLQDTNIKVTPEQEEKLKKLMSPFTDEEYKDLLRKCRQAPEIFGWQTMKHEPLCKS